MADAARRRETIHLAAVYRFHPRFEDGAFHVWYDDGNFSQPRAKVQGGDVLVIGRGVVVLGIGQFTSAQAIEWLATAMFAAGSAREVLAVELPQARLRTRLDSLLTMVDRGVFAAGVGVEQLRCWSLRPGEDAGELRVERTGALLPGLARALGTHDLRFIATGNHGNDVLTIAPGVVMSFEHNAATNADLRRAGIEVVTIAGAELGARHGGPRRISCPLERDPVF